MNFEIGNRVCLKNNLTETFVVLDVKSTCGGFVVIQAENGGDKFSVRPLDITLLKETKNGKTN
jgi:hypothetical protein